MFSVAWLFSNITVGILNEITLQKKSHDNTGFGTKKNIIVRGVSRIWDLWHHNLTRYLLTTETSERIDCSQANSLFQVKFAGHIFFQYFNMHC